MCSYTKVNGTHASENKWLLTDVLRGEWGFDGLVMSDWGAVRDRVAGVKAGLDLDMPGGVLANRASIVGAVESGELSLEELDLAVANVLKLVADSRKVRADVLEKNGVGEGEQSKNGAVVSAEKDMNALLRDHNDMAADMATDCAVLLKNEGILPLNRHQKVLIVGELFEEMRYQGAGSSGICPKYLTSPRQAFDQAGEAYTYAQGYHASTHRADEELVDEVLREAEKADVILFFGGLTERFESEGFDRKDLSMPENQLKLLEQLYEQSPEIVVILFGGSPMELPFADEVDGATYVTLSARSLYTIQGFSVKLDEE
jgi:beta-glucosidase